jgi:hypothetical protein
MQECRRDLLWFLWQKRLTLASMLGLSYLWKFEEGNEKGPKVFTQVRTLITCPCIFWGDH